jgi:hypothetical protein
MPKEDHLYKLRKAEGPKWNPEDHHIQMFSGLKLSSSCRLFCALFLLFKPFQPILKAGHDNFILNPYKFFN